MTVENTFISPAIYEREISLQAPSRAPFGTPGGVVGTSLKGPAFIPVLLGDWSEFMTVFGEPDYDEGHFGPYAVKEFLKYASSVVYTRVLGAGYGERGSNGIVPGAGSYFGSASGSLGGVYFLGAVHHSTSLYTGYLDECTLPAYGQGVSRGMGYPLIKGVLVAKSGVVASLKDNRETDDSIAFSATGTYGHSDWSDSSFVLGLDGHTNSVEYPKYITASLDETKANYFVKVLNRDMTRIADFGYALYSDFGVADLGIIDGGDTQAPVAISGSNFILAGSANENIAFILSGTTPSSDVPDFNDYRERYTAPISPYIVSNNIGGTNYKLFRVEALSDGAWANERIKISIRDIRKSTSDKSDFGTFTLLIRDFNDTDTNPVVLEQYTNLDLNVDSENYIIRRIGDRSIYFDHDQEDDAEKRIVIDGDFANISQLVRVLPTDDMKNGNIPDGALPFGYEGFFMLKTSGSLDISGIPIDDTNVNSPGPRAVADESFNHAVVPPIPMRTELSKKFGNLKTKDTKLYWGVKFERTINDTVGGIEQPNYSQKQENAIKGFTKFYGSPYPGTSDYSSTTATPVWLQSEQPLSGTSKIWNNEFNLENIAVATSSGGVADRTKIHEWSYRRSGTIPAGSRSFSAETDLNLNNDIAKFSFFMQYGWDGVDITNKDESLMNQTSMYNASIGDGWETNIAASYKQAIDIITAQENTDINLLAVPDIRARFMTDYVTEKCENRFDCLYIMDVENYDADGDIVNALTSSTRLAVGTTVSNFDSRGLDSNFAAAYWPDVKLQDEIENKMIMLPASVSIMGAMAFNDKVAFPWFAPAGFNRGALSSVVDLRIRTFAKDRDALYAAKINPLYSQPGKGVVVYGQKTLQSVQGALDRVNVRRLMIELRRAVKSVAQRILFEPNTQQTWSKFRKLIDPILARIQEQSGIDRFKVVIDETTTSKSDIDGYILRGKIFVQPTRTTEMIALDFVVTNDGTLFE